MSQEKPEDILKPIIYSLFKACMSFPDYMNEYRTEVTKKEPFKIDDVLKTVGEMAKPYEQMIPASARLFLKLARSGGLSYVMKIAEKLAGD
ncbi:MAG: hypothetical protein J4452_01775 [Candidatus Aenigmarchaeota archaeon]|nr:hypothetical protein [Candidatus Aenigmarchaeota archaeon]